MKIYPNGSSIVNKKIVKWGIDPTGSRLHLGHFVAIRFLRKMLAEYRDVVVIIGNLTASIGDPSGTVKERPVLHKEVVDMNADFMEIQLKKLLPKARFVRNRDLLNQWSTLVGAASQFTTSELLDRNAFQGRSVRADEMLVPILQAIDSVSLGAQVEVGGEDQEFNFSITRKLQEKWGQEPEVCVMFPIIRGTDGQKMSKSLGNCIYLDDGDIIGKVLSIPDDVMDEWFPLFCDQEPKVHPFERKKQLADAIVKEL